jgi:ribosomal protein RSM22 (predicted rRNA methylase)
MATDLPPDLQAGLDRMMRGVARTALAQRASAISQAYRSGQGSAQTIRSMDDALAYALARLPATFAATTAVLAALHEAMPHFAPRTMLDVGAGPGTASWAAVGCFPRLARIELLDENEFLCRLARELLSFSTSDALREAAYREGAARQLLGAAVPADLTIAGYFIGEVSDALLASTADMLWSRAAGILVLIEPGTPAGFRRIRQLRSHLIGRQAHVVCPCPHNLECPLTGDDWCHFSQRLNRSRDHRQVKGASLPFEDEKFSYVALSRDKPAQPADRVLAAPRVTKAQITTKLCTPEGLVTDVVSRRVRHTYRARKSWRWGDAVSRSLASADEGNE